MGTYGEGQVYQMVDQLRQMKADVIAGKMTLADFQDQAGQLVPKINSLTGSISSKGSGAANAVNPAWKAMQDEGFTATQNGKMVAGMPFTRQEYAKLPNNVLPTQDDINSGLFDPSAAPLQRVQTAPTPTDQPVTPPPASGPATPQPTTPPPGFTPTNPAQDGNNPATGTAVPINNDRVGGAPVFTANPNNPGPNGGLIQNGTQAAMDSSQIANEAALQAQLATQSQQGVTAQRAKYLKDLTGLLNQNAQNQLNDQAPGIMEDLNSRGLLRSSALGNSMATAAKSLTANTTNQLAQQAIAGETSDLGNLTGIQNTYNQGRNSALQRQFSVEDYNNQLAAGKALGDQYANIKPQTPSTKTQGTQTAAAVLPAAATIAAK